MVLRHRKKNPLRFISVTRCADCRRGRANERGMLMQSEFGWPRWCCSIGLIPSDKCRFFLPKWKRIAIVKERRNKQDEKRRIKQRCS